MKKRTMREYVPYDYETAYTKSIDDMHEWFRQQMATNRKKCVYALKEVRAGEQLEVEMYPEYKSMDDVPLEGRQIKKDNSKAQRNLNDKNARKYVERLINTNFGDDDLWITLTYAVDKEPNDMDEAARNMQNYIRRIGYRRKKLGLPPTKYVYITEYDPDADIRWHHHMVMDGGLAMDEIEKAWGKGQRNQVRKLQKDEYGLVGMANYITKNKNRPKNQKRWNASQGLSQPHIRKVHSKPVTAGQGNYKAISTYVNKAVRDYDYIRQQLAQWYPDYIYTDCNIYYNDYNGQFYIHARLRHMPSQYDGHRATKPQFT